MAPGRDKWSRFLRVRLNGKLTIPNSGPIKKEGQQSQSVCPGLGVDGFVAVNYKLKRQKEQDSFRLILGIDQPGGIRRSKEQQW